MNENIKYIDRTSEIPLAGVDFLGIIDRGTNILELKPLTQCNLRCKYCFVSSGDYDTNFVIDSNYLIDKVKEAIAIKGNYNIEIHLAPYGEILLYGELFNLVKNLSDIEGVTTISMHQWSITLEKYY